MLGIQLTDDDVGNVPLLRTDAYGNFIPGAERLPAGHHRHRRRRHSRTRPTTSSSRATSAAPVGLDVAGALRTGHAFLADIAHNAVPNGLADGDIEIGLANPGNDAGDLRQRAARRALHRRRRPRQREHRPDRRPPRLPLPSTTGWSSTPRTWCSPTQATWPSSTSGWLDDWLGDVADDAGADRRPACGTASACSRPRSSAPRCSTSTSCSRSSPARSSRNIDVFLVPDGYDATINPSIVAEFAHVVYRFGHSMLTETIDRFDPNFTADQIGLIEGFLNPLAFNGDRRAIADGIAAGAIIRGMTRQVGNEIDEFVTERAAQQPARPAARPRDHQPGARPRHRRAVAERGARASSTRRPTRTPCSSPTRAGSTSPATSSTKPRSSTSSPPTARTR